MEVLTCVCHMLIFVKIKIIFFQHFSDVLFELYLNPPFHPNHLKVRGLIFF